jgi:hypothetical protein
MARRAASAEKGAPMSADTTFRLLIMASPHPGGMLAVAPVEIYRGARRRSSAML